MLLRRFRRSDSGPVIRLIRWFLRWVLRLIVVVALVVLAFRWVNPPLNYYQASEWWRLGALDRDWVALEDISGVMARSAVAAEDANYCLHWGIDLEAIQEVLESGSRRGASTITQQVAKNVFLWHGRSMFRKALEAGFALAIEAAWGKRRILEVYLNVAEFDTGVFGVGAASEHYFGVPAAELTLAQASRLAAVLPDPKGRSASKPSPFVVKRATGISSGANTILSDGRAACFEDSEA